MLRRIMILCCLSLISVGAYADSKPANCTKQTIVQAKKLLTFHFGPDERIRIDDSVKKLAPMANPANRKQQFQVYEVWGYIYKGQYRMRMIYFEDKSGDCILMGQEILEYASL